MVISEDKSQKEFSVAYNGSKRKHDHTIDVEALGPALMAFGKLLREANLELNGKKSSAKVLITSEFEHKCFQINFEYIVHVWEQVKSILGPEPIKTAKEILEQIGFLKSAAGTGTAFLSYLAYLKWKNGRKVTNAQQVKDHDKSGSVSISVQGDNNPVIVNNNVYNLSLNQKALKATRDVFQPIGQEGFEELDVKSDGVVVSKLEFNANENILSSCNSGIAELSEKEPDVEETTAWLSVYSPVFDTQTKNWRFNLGREHVLVDISETNIAEEALTRGEVSPDNSYQVRLEITTPVDIDGKRGKASYKMLEVIKFIPAAPKFKQADLL